MILRTLVALLLFTSFNLKAQESDGLDNMSLEDLLNIQTSVATGSKAKGLTTRESPAIVSVITADEIRKTGARDLVDVLRLVPGFTVQTGADNSGTLTPSLRGLKAGEGKMLLQVNGFSFVDMSYVNVQVFNRFPIDQIKTIEIIRGPGSALYGGNAELTVVNILLKEGADLKGGEISGLYSHMVKTSGRQNGTLAYGNSSENLEYSAHVFGANAELSDRDYVDETGDAYRFDKASGYNSRFIDLNVRYKKLTARALYADYVVGSTDSYNSEYYGAVITMAGAYDTHFTNLQTSLSYDLELLGGK